MNRKLMIGGGVAAGLMVLSPVLLIFALMALPLAVLSSLAGGPPPPGVTSITQTYLPMEQSAVLAYCHKIPVTKTVTDPKTGKKTTVHTFNCVGVNVAFVQAVMRQESDGWLQAISSAGAMGLMQTTLGKYHLSNLGFGTSQEQLLAQDPFNPEANINVGVQFLDYLYQMFGGNLPLVAAGYNAGPGVPLQWEQTYHTSNWAVLSQEPAVRAFANGQTYNYVNAVMKYYAEFTAGAYCTAATLNHCAYSGSAGHPRRVVRSGEATP